MVTHELDALLDKSWALRSLGFPAEIEFVYPGETLAVSTTGRECALSCAHCGGHYLKPMATLEQALGSAKGNKKSYLVSGGCDLDGNVPHLQRRDEITALSQLGPLNIHSGLVEEGQARELAEVASVVSFDFVVDEETIQAVYGMEGATGQRYVESYRLLRRHTRVVPHVCIGLFGGQILGEYKALEALKHEGADAISFIVFRPTPGTTYADKTCPPVNDVARIIATARLMFPDALLYLGCMRPGGHYRSILDGLAIRAGVNKIVQPSPAARKLAGELGLQIIRTEECCSL
jgi:uncharacterized radical SAM superfamily protein